ncbi:CBS domain-containing protein [Micromonospora sp. SL4-19]|uniref:CBS domain-containing protein n=1 Tax=Micromonospora sp. SL4-19 TaxID=3399129 RepID=UPI003A4E521F
MPRRPRRQRGRRRNHTVGMILPYSDDIATAIRTRHLQTPIARVLCYGVDTPASDVAGALADAGFDYAPVTRDGEICGYVRRVDLVDCSGPLAAQARPLTASRVIAGDTPLAALLPALRNAEFLFVVDGHDIVGIVSPADLNKQPARTYFYLLVSTLELTLAERTRGFFDDQDKALELLRESRRERIRERLAAEARDDVVADVVAAMDFTDLMNVVKKTEPIRSGFGSYSAGQWEKEVSAPLINLRHDVMHTVRTLATDAPSSLQRLIGLDDQLRKLLST